MLKSFIQFINESLESKEEFVKRLAQTLITKIRTSSMEESTEYSVFSGMEFIEPFTFDLIVNVRRDSSPDLEEDSHFEDLPWEKINYDKLGYSIDANTRMSRDKSSVPKIIFHIILNPRKEPLLYSKLQYRLIDILAHETNHLDQLGMNRDPFNSHVSSKDERESAKKSYRYFLLMDEIESMIEGMYQSSKEQGCPIDQVFDDYLIPFIESGYMSESEYKHVMQVWVTRAVELYPDATFSNQVDNIVNSL